MDTTVGISVAILGSVGLLFGTLIALATKKLWVFEDPRVDTVSGMLPGNNCGACGQAGCRAFAESVIAGRVQPAQCSVMGADGVKAVAAYLGVDAGAATRRVARVLCGGGSDLSIRYADYRGLQTCAAATAVGGGGKACSWACLGYADCARACTFHAIVMNDRDLPVVTPSLCTACGDCVEACPRGLITLMPVEHRLIVQCRSLLEGSAAEALCAAACTGCARCVADAAPGLIRISDGLAVIDYTKHALADPSATRRCPTGAIVWIEGVQFMRGRTVAPPARTNHETVCA
jgi:Na+-translocating ferredoxin:NAD+ oxidoreductase RNF subunit RnfB